MIVLTGSIATGKSSTCRLLERANYTIVDADIIAKKLINADIIAALFGSSFIKNGKVDTKALGNLVFGDVKQRQKLNNYIHPLIRNEIKVKVEELKKSCSKYIVDIPLYFESGHYDANLVCVVYCPRKKQIQRLIKRGNLSLDEALKRIESQIDIEAKKERADFIIDNSRDKEHLLRETEKFIRYLDANFKV